MGSAESIVNRFKQASYKRDEVILKSYVVGAVDPTTIELTGKLQALGQAKKKILKGFVILSVMNYSLFTCVAKQM